MDKQQSGFDQQALEQIPAALKSVVDAGDLSGIVSLIWRDGEIVQLNTIGMRDIEHKKPMTRDTMFRIASMTKPVTTVAALMLLEEGKIRLEDPISRWLPEFANMRVLRDPSGPIDEVYESPRPITVEDLMTHRAGFAYAFTSVGPIGQAHDEAVGHPLFNPLSPDEWLKRLAGLPLSFSPGDRLHYGHSTEVLGFLVGRVAGISYREFLFDRLLKPLGMVDTDFYVPAAKRERCAVLYEQDAETGRLKAVPFPHYDAPPAYTAGGGGLISTLDDYLRFARMLLNDGEFDGTRYLKPETVRLMRTNRLTQEQRDIPFLGLPFWAGQGFGLGLSVIMDPAKHDWMGAGSEGSFGWPGVFGTWWLADPVKNMILLFLIQNSTSLSPDMAGRAVTGARMGARIACPMFQKMTYGALR